ncbi:MAG: PilW family protein [Pseudomonadales bacterium]
MTDIKSIKNRRSSQRGLSLIEVMIALALGSVITVGVVQLFVANSETHRLMMGQSRMQESARFSLDFIGRSIRQAGYRGCFSSNDDLPNTFVVDPLIDKPPYEYDLQFGVQGFDGTLLGWNPGLDILPQTTSAGVDTNVYSSLVLVAADSTQGAGNGIDIAAIVPGTDVITLRNMDQQDIEARLNDLLGATAPIVVNQPSGGLNLLVDHLAVIHDCEKAMIFRVTSISTSGGLTTIGHDTGDTDDFKNDFFTLAVKNSFFKDASVTAIESHTYYIAPGLGENSQGDTPLSLWRKSNLFAPIELVEGVEDLQILYGVSTDGNATPNLYIAASPGLNWKQVTTIRITVIVNSIDDVGGTSTTTHGCGVHECVPGENFDGLIRKAFTQTIKLRNTS